MTQKYDVHLYFIGKDGKIKKNPLGRDEIQIIKAEGKTVCKKARSNLDLFFIKKGSKKYQLILRKEGIEIPICTKQGSNYLSVTKKIFQSANKVLNGPTKRKPVLT